MKCQLICVYLKKLLREIGISNLIFYLIVLTILFVISTLQPVFIALIFNKENRLEWVMLLLLLLSFLSASMINFPQNRMLQKVRFHSKAILFEDLNHRSYLSYTHLKIGEVQTWIQEVSFCTRSLQYESWTMLLNITVVVIIYSIMLFSADATLGLTFVTSYGIYCLISIYLSKNNSTLIGCALDAAATATDNFIDFFKNFEVIFSNQTQLLEEKNYTSVLEKEK